jgi:hypothetical protein
MAPRISTFEGRLMDGQNDDDAAGGKVLFNIFTSSSMYDEIVITRDPKSYFKTHVIVPIKKVDDPGEPEFIAMKLKENVM